MSNVMIRYGAYDRCLSNVQIRYRYQDLIAEAEKDLYDVLGEHQTVSRSQFYQDIKAMQRAPFFAPIENYKQGRTSYFRYADENYSIGRQPLSQNEAEQLRTALGIMGRFRGMPQFQWVGEVIHKLEQRFNLAASSEDYIGFEENEYKEGLQFLGPLLDAIFHRRVADIRYQSFNRSEPTSHVISPYFLKQYANRWYLLGHNAEYSELRTLSLDRIVSVNPASSAFVRNETYGDFVDYFDEIIGVTKPKDSKSTLIKLWYTPEQARYVETKPLHGTQVLRYQDDGSAIVTLDVIANFELKQKILQDAERVKVLEPPELALEIRERLEQALGLYE